MFSALISREQYASSQLESLADQLTGGSLAPQITQLVVQKKISPAEIKGLRRILDDSTDDGGRK